MAALDYSWNLEERLQNVSCEPELKIEINRFIKTQHEKNTGKPYSFGNLYYRGNLHYIEDNISKPTLLIELRNFNNNTNETRTQKN